MLTVHHLRDLTLNRPSHPDRPAHVSAASGLVCVGDTAYVVADDELHLGVFSLEGSESGRLLPLFPGELPREHQQRKRQKPDLEALTLLPPAADFPFGALLALGSASTTNRRRGAMVPLNADGLPESAAHILPLGAWYDFLETRIGRLNLEGAYVDGAELVLLQRANKGNRLNAIIRLALPEFIAPGRPADFLPTQLNIIEVELGDIDNVPLGFTDGMALPQGGFVFSAVAEDTQDSYHDGACLGTVIGVMSAKGKLIYREQLAVPWKVEGISASVREGGIDLLMVTDADDETVPVALLAARIEDIGFLP